MQYEMKSGSPVIESVEIHKNKKTLDNGKTSKKGKFFCWEFETEIKWVNVFILTLLNVLTIYAILTHDYLRNPWLPLYVYILFVFGGFGIAAGAHRYWTHRSYKAKLPLRIILILCYASSGQNSIRQWVMDHTVHHKYSETNADPHNTKRGFFFSHMGWLMLKKHPDVISKGKEFDFSYLYDDPLVEFHDRHFFWFKALICYIIPTMIPVYLWGESWWSSFLGTIVKQVTVAHGTFAINSFAHFYGTKPYDKNIYPANNASVSFYTLGEGFHNYHHTFPWDYRAHDMTNISFTTEILNFFGKIGWAYDMRYPSQKLIDKVAKKYGDGTFISWEYHIAEEECEEMEKSKSL